MTLRPSRSHQAFLLQLSRPREQVGDELGIKISDLDFPTSRRLRRDAIAVAPVDQAADPVGREVRRQRRGSALAVSAEDEHRVLLFRLKLEPAGFVSRTETLDQENRFRSRL